MRSWFRGVSVLMASTLIAGVLSVVGVAVTAAPAGAGTSDGDCPFADVITPTECQITQTWTVGAGGVAANNFPAALPGPFAFHKTLHILGTGKIDASASGGPGITLNIDGTGETGGGGAGGALLMDS